MNLSLFLYERGGDVGRNQLRDVTDGLKLSAGKGITKGELCEPSFL